MPFPFLVGISGRARHGKDTVADVLVQELGATKRYFAGPLKYAARAAFGFTDDQVWGDAKEAVDPFWGITPRKALQMVGTDMFRNLYRSDFWVQAFERSVSVLGGIILVPDVRFPEEAQLIRRQGGYLVRVTRIGYPRPADEHSSEGALDSWLDWDYEIMRPTGVAILRNDAKLLAARVREAFFASGVGT